MSADEKRRARVAARHGVKISGRCARCRKRRATDRHHPDHAEPLAVVLLCRQCHLEIHREDLRAAGLRGAMKRWGRSE